MGLNSAIQWTDDTWNPWRGCDKVSAGCKNCYMFTGQRRFGRDPEKIIKAASATFEAPKTKLKGPLIFTCSWSDFFHPAADAWRDEAWDIIKATPYLTYQILTKRPELIYGRLPADWGDGYPNVWMGVTVENRREVPRLYKLFDIPAAQRFVSYEPALEMVDFWEYLPRLDWLISGGESGPGCRPADLAWFRLARDRCREAGVPFFHKQYGGIRKIDGAWGGQVLDGRIHNFIPGFTAKKKEIMVQGSLF